jgi:hypothetical protein
MCGKREELLARGDRKFKSTGGRQERQDRPRFLPDVAILFCEGTCQSYVPVKVYPKGVPKGVSVYVPCRDDPAPIQPMMSRVI